MNWFEPTDEQRIQWEEFTRTRPDSVRKIIERYAFAPWKLYRLTTSNHRVTIYSFDEHDEKPASIHRVTNEERDEKPVTMRVNVTGEFNVVTFSRTVFGISPEDLVECDLPLPGEPVGDLKLNPHEAKAFVDKLKTMDPREAQALALERIKGNA